MKTCIFCGQETPSSSSLVEVDIKSDSTIPKIQREGIYCVRCNRYFHRICQEEWQQNHPEEMCDENNDDNLENVELLSSDHVCIDCVSYLSECDSIYLAH